MNKILLLSFSLLLLPVCAFAHETRMYEINGVEYEIVVGSLNEPVVVDDKTGVSVEIVRDGAFLAGASDSLQVEMIAGDKKKIVNLSPVYGYEGQYKSNFIATVPTTLTYRIFGTLEDKPVNISFTCNPAGHPQAEEDTERTEISDGVVQTLKRGAFGCPLPKEDLGFPESATSEVEMQRTLAEEKAKNEKTKTDPLLVGSLILSLFAAGVGLYSLKKSK